MIGPTPTPDEMARPFAERFAEAVAMGHIDMAEDWAEEAWRYVSECQERTRDREAGRWG